MSLDGNPSFVCWRHRDKLTTDTWSAYSTMMLRRSGRIAFYYEESHDGMEKVYDMIYTEIPLETITSGRYSYRSK